MKSLIVSLCFLSTIVSAQTDSISNNIKSKLNHHALNPVHSILLYIENEDKQFIYNEGLGLEKANGKAVTKHSAFKIASSTKLFVSTIILQLQEEGKLSISDKVFPYVEDIEDLNFKNFHNLDSVKHAKDITIKQLLSHRSGLADIFTDKEDAFFALVMKNPNKQYDTTSIIQLYYQFHLNQTPHCKPNEAWHYSDINYVLLGLIIQQIDKITLAQSIRKRIIDPLQMENTFFEFYETPNKQASQINQYLGQTNFSNINTSFDWAGGGLVSTNADLAIFIKALFNYKLINKSSLDQMIDVKFTKTDELRYGLGVYEFHINNNVYYGHFGFYNTFIGYCPKTKTTLSYSISQATPSFNAYTFISQLLNYVDQ